MSKILEDVSVSKNLIVGLENFYTMFDIRHILHRVGADKGQGISGKRVLFALLSVVFMRIKLSEAISKAKDSFGFGKDILKFRTTESQAFGCNSSGYDIISVRIGLLKPGRALIFISPPATPGDKTIHIMPQKSCEIHQFWTRKRP